MTPYLLFIAHPLETAAFLFLIFTLLSLWVRKSAYLWGALLAISLTFAFLGKGIDGRALIPLTLLFACYLLLKKITTPYSRWICISLIFILSTALMSHLFAGFNNWQIVSASFLSEGARPYSLYLNYDKPFVALFPLALTIPLIPIKNRFQKKEKSAPPRLKSWLLKTSLCALVGAPLLIACALALHFIRFDPKAPLISPLYLIVNLFFVTLPEEALFRGFLQQELYTHLRPKTKWEIGRAHV